MKTKIFVTVGTALPFDRLIKTMDIFDTTKFEIIAQVGNTTYVPKNIAKYSKTMFMDKLWEEITNCDIVVLHAGIGTILDLVKLDKPCVLVPRLKKFGEAVDDHQLEICKQLEKQGAVVCYDMKDISKKINSAKSLNGIKSKEYGKLKENINVYLN